MLIFYNLQYLFIRNAIPVTTVETNRRNNPVMIGPTTAAMIVSLGTANDFNT